MLNRNQVAVVMSTYNGEKYIREQINSILDQEDVEISLFIRDDGSNDNTLSIIKEYDMKYKNIHLILDGQNLGPAVSFMHLLYQINGYDYYAFADQDDLWKKRKVITGIQSIQNINKPALYCSNQILYIDGKETGYRFKSKPPIDYLSTLFANKISGCTMLFNDQLFHILVNDQTRVSDEILRLRMHDTWVMLVADLMGTIVYDSSSYIDYRIHSNNTVGVKRKSTFEIIKTTLKHLSNKSALEWRSCTANEILNKLSIQDESKRKTIAKLSNTHTLHNKMELFKDKEILKRSGLSKPVYYTYILLGWL